MNIKSLCILRLSAIGDVCHAVAMVERIQRMSPDIALTWIIGKVEYQLVKDIPGVEFIVFDKRQGRKAFWDLRARLAGRRFDGLFLMQVALRANIASLCIRARYRFGFDKARSKELHSLFINRRIAAQRHGHVLEGFMGFAEAAGIGSSEQINWHIPLSDADLAWASTQVASKKYIVINPAASKVERNWLPERYAQVADHLADKGYCTVLTGGPGEAEIALAGQITTSMQHACINLVGKTSLKQLLAVLKSASLVIAPDTGPAHMATAVQTPVVGLYAHSNPRRTGPYTSQQNVVSVYDEQVQIQQGKPWQDLPWGTRVKGSELMSLIATEDVIQVVEKALSI